MKKNVYCLIMLLFCCLCFLTGCNSSDGVESKAYVIAIGLDNGQTNILKLSLQFAILSGNSESSGSSSSSGSDNEPSTVISVECSSIDSGINLINSYISKKINLSHCKVIIISEELAESGISDYVYNLASNIEIRPQCHILISRCNASDFLEQSSPIFESNPANYYERIFSSSKYSGYVENTYFYNFYNNILSTTSEATAILCGINTDKTHDTQSEYSLDGSYKADESPIKSKNNAEIIGTAVFCKDKLIGELDNIETMCHQLITNELNNTTITIPSPYQSDTNISISLSLNKKTKNKISFVNGFPFIECNVNVIGDVLSMEPSLDLNNIDTINLLNSCVNVYLENVLSDFLYKTSVELKADINDFGKYALIKYKTWDEWIDSDWLNNYQNTCFKITVNTDIQDGYLFTKI